MSVSPQNWSKEALKRRVRFAYGDSLASENRNDGDVPVFGSNGVVGAHDRSITHAPAIVIGRKGSSGRVVWSDVPCFPIDTTYFVDRTQTRENMRWLFYALESLGLDKINFDSAVPGLSRELAYSLPLVFPPLPEQQHIAAYLDTSCAAIDAAVAAKRRQLETLDALCGSILLRAITMGLDELVETQPTGAVILPKMPTGWRLGRLKSVASIRYGLGQPPAELASGVAMIRATDVDAGTIRTDNLLRVDPNELPPGRNPYLQAGEIIVVRSGAYTGDSAIVPSALKGAVAGYDMVVTVERASARFIAYCLLSRYVLEGQLLLLTLRAAQPHLNARELGSVVLALPPTQRARGDRRFP